jgi:hypothetical protein
LLVSNNAFGKPSSGAKTLGRKFTKCFRKPWGSTYPTEVISKNGFNQTRVQGDGGFSYGIGDH